MAAMSSSISPRNTGWLYENDGDATLVFVHGVLSNNLGAWRHGRTKTAADRATAPSIYWPELIRSDPRFQDIAIFLAGYHTAIDSGEYGIRRCADEVFNGLNVTDSRLRSPPIEKSKIIFVCHSLGGIVTRYMLTEQFQAFAGKSIGLFLIASPSGGSQYGNALSGICDLYRHQQGQELAWKSWALDDIDARFRRLLEERRIPKLKGMELCEHHGPMRFPRLKFLPWRLPPIVPAESAGRYFGPVVMVPESDHSSICKPRDPDDRVHTSLYHFLARNGLLPSEARSGELPLAALEEDETERSVRALDALMAWLHAKPTVQHSEALTAIHQAALATGKYIGDRHLGIARSRQTEKRLADLWFAVAAQLQPHEPEIASYCYLKGHGWADERVWESSPFRDKPLQLTQIIELALHRQGALDSSRPVPFASVRARHNSGEGELTSQVRRLIDEASASIVDTAIRRTLDIPHGELNDDDFVRVTELDLSATEISDLRPLKRLTHLTTLNLANCTALRDLGPLADLPTIRLLNLASIPGIRDLAPLGALRQLLSVNLEGCTDITELGALAGLRALQRLQLSGTPGIHDLAPLARLEALRCLLIDRCPQVRDLRPLERLHGLAELYLQGSGVEDLSPLAFMTKLESLDLSECRCVIDLGPLWRLTKLTYLGARDCAAIADFSALACLTKLPSLNLNGCLGLADLGPIGALSELRLLYLCRCANVSDLRPLSKLGKLASLALNGCTKISDLTPVAHLPSLRELDIEGCSNITTIPPPLRSILDPNGVVFSEAAARP
jgi:hypothetical protein